VSLEKTSRDASGPGWIDFCLRPETSSESNVLRVLHKEIPVNMGTFHIAASLVSVWVLFRCLRWCFDVLRAHMSMILTKLFNSTTIHNSPADWARQLFKPSVRSPSLLEKKNNKHFLFLVWGSLWGTDFLAFLLQILWQN